MHLHPPTAAPGATATTATTRVTVAGTVRPSGPPPMDGEAAAGPAGGPAGAGTAPAGSDGAQAAASVTAYGQPEPAATGQAPAAASVYAPPSVPATVPVPGLPPNPGPTAVAAEPGQGTPAGTTPPADRPLSDYPAEIRDYIAELRRESGENRVKAKTAEDAAKEQMTGFLDKMAAAFGLTTEAPPEADPAVQAQQLTEQLAAARSDHSAAQVELAVWKGAALHDADPGRLTDSRRFITAVSKLDPAADDFDTQLAAAIGAAVAADPSLKTVQAGPAPAAPPPVPSGGEFAGGPSGHGTGPQSVDDFRDVLKKARPR